MLAAVLVLAHANGAFAAPAAEPNQPKPGVSLTVYPKFGVVTEIRQVEIAKDGSAELDDVAATMRPNTVCFESLTDPNAIVVEQCYHENDAAESLSMLTKYVGKQLTVTTDKGVHRGRLLVARVLQSYGGFYSGTIVGRLVIQAADGKVSIVQARQVQSIDFGEVIEGLRVRPTLLWRVQTTKRGKQMARVSYQVEDMSWKAEYSLVLDDASSKAALSAWIGFANHTGRAYSNARLTFVAGDFARISDHEREGGTGIFDDIDSTMVKRPFFEYNLYTVPRPVTLANDETKQVEIFAPVRDLPVSEMYMYQPLPEEAWGFTDDSDTDEAYTVGNVTDKVTVSTAFSNSKANRLGMPLPAGKVSVYRRNADGGGLILVAENMIDHTPRGKATWLQIGVAGDIVGERKQTNANYEDIGTPVKETVKIILRNSKDKDVTVRVKEPIRAWKSFNDHAEWSITKETHKHQKLDSRTVVWDVPVKAHGHTKLTYTAAYKQPIREFGPQTKDQK